ncbi:MAG: hypothetical protein NTV34_05835, partial [Proteobacteria bacterium]|nr:hypothetical protein [Pseudomonadota bacterium]
CEDYGENMIAVEAMLGPVLSPKAEWFNKDYLLIEDKTGNPFELGAPLYRDPKLRDDKRKGAFGRDDRSGKPGGKPLGDRGPNSEPRSPSMGSNDRNGRNRDEGRPLREGELRRPREQNHRNQGNRGPTNNIRGDQPVVRSGVSAQGKSASLAASAGDMGFIGSIKKVFKALFGKK